MNYSKPSLYAAIFSSSLLLHPLAKADVSYQETTQVTGGSLQGMMKLAGVFSSQAKQANTPVTTTIALHGNRMVRSNPHSTEIIDLDQHTITSIDHDKHTYSVVTFQQMQQAMANASAKTRAQSNTPDNSAGSAQMNFDAHVSSSGATRNIDGRNAKEALVTITMLANSNDSSNVKAGMAATSEMWLVSDVPGVAELRVFNQRLASELAVDAGGNSMSGLLSAEPGGTEAVAELKKEAAKMNGVPVLQVTRVGISPDGKPLAAPSAAPIAQTRNGHSQAGAIGTEVATETGADEASSQIGKLGTFGRALGNSSMGALMRHKPSSPPKPSSTAPDSSTASNVLLESQTEMSNFSTAPVDLNSFQIAPGYKQVTSPMVAR
jgi:hypothetical protein